MTARLQWSNFPMFPHLFLYQALVFFVTSSRWYQMLSDMFQFYSSKTTCRSSRNHT